MAMTKSLSATHIIARVDGMDVGRGPVRLAKYTKLPHAVSTIARSDRESLAAVQILNVPVAEIGGQCGAHKVDASKSTARE